MPGERLDDDSGESKSRDIYNKDVAYKHACRQIGKLRRMAKYRFKVYRDALGCRPLDMSFLQLAGSYWDLLAVAEAGEHQQFSVHGLELDDSRGLLVSCVDLPTPANVVGFTIPLFRPGDCFLSVVEFKGFSIPRFVPVTGRGRHYERLGDFLAKLKPKQVVQPTPVQYRGSASVGRTEAL